MKCYINVLKNGFINIQLTYVRCRLVTSSSCRRFEGFGCSPIKVVRELGLIRRKTVWFLSFLGGKN